MYSGSYPVSIWAHPGFVTVSPVETVISTIYPSFITEFKFGSRHGEYNSFFKSFLCTPSHPIIKTRFILSESFPKPLIVFKLQEKSIGKAAIDILPGTHNLL
jgi:hypothetical protein